VRAQLDSDRNSKDSEVLADLLQERYSCRGFLPYRVSRTTIQTILGIARRTASWCNSQPWQISIASGEATRRLREELLRKSL
jgi:nitroreductase